MEVCACEQTSVLSLFVPSERSFDLSEGSFLALLNNEPWRTFEIVRQRFEKVLIVGLLQTSVTTSPSAEPSYDATEGALYLPSIGTDHTIQMLLTR